MDQDSKEAKIFNRIAVLHKTYAWLLILLALASILIVKLDLSFGSFLVINGLDNTLIINYYVSIVITLLFGVFNLFIAKEFKKYNLNAMYLSIFSIIFIIVLRDTMLDYLFAASVTILLSIKLFWKHLFTKLG